MWRLGGNGLVRVPAAERSESAVRMRGECKQSWSVTLCSWWSELSSYHILWEKRGILFRLLYPALPFVDRTQYFEHWQYFLLCNWSYQMLETVPETPQVWRPVSIQSWQTFKKGLSKTLTAWVHSLLGGEGVKVILLILIWHLSVSTEQPSRCLPLQARLLWGEHINSCKVKCETQWTDRHQS